LPQYRAKCAAGQIVPVYRHDCLPAGIIAMPQEMMRSLGSDHLEAGPLQRRDDRAGRVAPAARSCVRGGDRHQLIDR